MINIEKLFFQIENNIESVIKEEQGLGRDLFRLLLQQHPADIAMLISKLEDDHRIILFKKLPPIIEIKVFENLSEIIQAALLVKMDTETAATILKKVTIEELAELFDYLPDEDLKKYLKMLQTKQRDQIISRLNFDPESAGRIMNSDVITLQKDFTVKKSIELLQRIGEQKELLQRIYITDCEHRLQGYIELDDLVLNKPDTSIKNIIKKTELCINVNEDQENVANQIRHYNLLTVPVTDSKNHFLGVITANQVLEVVEEEASEDVYKLSGLTRVEHSYFETPLWKFVWQRFPWLVGLLLLQSISSFILAGYKDTVDKYFIISMFLTMLIGTGGNAGNQSSALVVRGLATGEMNRQNGLSVLLREFSISIFIAFSLVIVGFFRVYILGGSLISAFVVSLALFFIILTSMFLGTLIPLLFERFNIDPAHSAAPFLATLMDILGVLIYCFVASKILG